MDTTPSDIAASFDGRAQTYNGNEWHRRCADCLVDFCGIGDGQVVLDVGTGTGFAAMAAARAVGAQGRVVAVDLSAGMLGVARRHVPGPTEACIEWVQGNAVDLPSYPTASFDVVVCATALLYMPVATALAEWHRLLKLGGIMAFSSMKVGFPVGGRVFRECAATFGFQLADPSEALGSGTACHAALQHAGFSATTLASATITFSAQDIGLAWESNLGSPAHAALRAAGTEALARMQASFEGALAREEQLHPGSTAGAELLFAKGVR